MLNQPTGFSTDDLLVVTEQDILGDRMTRAISRKKKSETFLAELSNFHAGDYVVHNDHGVGRYEGLETLDVGGAPHDCLRLIYEGNDKLFVPVENIEVHQPLWRRGCDRPARQAGLGGLAEPQGAGQQRIKDIAQQLMKIAAQRAIRETEPMQRPEGLYDEFCARFPYAETEDQLKAIDEVLMDLASGKPMDRLVCGDVGFGKTEVALRAAFTVAMGGRQVAIVTPTTLLCRQHFRNFTERFEGFPVQVRQLSRLVGHQGSERDQGGAEGGQGRYRDRHPCGAGEIDRVPRSRPGHRRRGAAFRRHAERAPEGDARRHPCADPDRDADPAHSAVGADRASAR